VKGALDQEVNGMFGASEDQVRSAREPSIREINATIPRRVRLDPDGGYAPLAFVLIFLCVGAIWFGGAFYYYIQQARHRDALNRMGREAIATITEIYSGRGSTSVYYTFRFSDAVYQGHARFPEDRYLDIHVGEQIPILFLPADPSVSHPSNWAWWSWWDLGPHVFMLMFPIFGVVGLGYLYRERRLARFGWVTEGKVIACAPKGSRFRVDYEFLSEDGTEFDGADECSDEYETESSIRVIYSRKNPKKNDTYPMSTYGTLE